MNGEVNGEVGVRGEEYVLSMITATNDTSQPGPRFSQLC